MTGSPTKAEGPHPPAPSPRTERGEPSSMKGLRPPAPPREVVPISEHLPFPGRPRPIGPIGRDPTNRSNSERGRYHRLASTQGGMVGGLATRQAPGSAGDVELRRRRADRGVLRRQPGRALRCWRCEWLAARGRWRGFRGLPRNCTLPRAPQPAFFELDLVAAGDRRAGAAGIFFGGRPGWRRRPGRAAARSISNVISSKSACSSRFETTIWTVPPPGTTGSARK